jgi:deoxyribose-phosphate aldolase
MTPLELAHYIDHTVLKPDAAEQAIQQLCVEARQHRFVSVCVQPCWVSLAAALLEDSGVLVCTVIGFPHGANTTVVKAFEAEEAIRQGAQELDMVINVGAVKSQQMQAVERDILSVVSVAHDVGAHVKVILECALLTLPEKRLVTEIVAGSGADFVKTSTGFGPHGATVEDVRLLREIAGERCGVKAAGGIRDLQTALAMIEAGADRLGTSASLAIVREV